MGSKWTCGTLLALPDSVFTQHLSNMAHTNLDQEGVNTIWPCKHTVTGNCMRVLNEGQEPAFRDCAPMWRVLRLLCIVLYTPT